MRLRDLRWNEIKRDIIFLGVTLLIIFFDQLTKWLVRIRLEGKQIPIIGNFLKLIFVKNTGIGFGLAQGYNIIFAFITVVIVIVLLIYYATLRREKAIPAALTAVIIGGAVGNLIDRFMLGYVTDFISFSFWPAFNIADAAVTLGVIGLIIYLVKNE